MQIRSFLRLFLTSVISLSMSPLYADEPEDSTVSKIVEIQRELHGGPYEGMRAVQSKGTVLRGDFYPANAAGIISKAEHFQGGPSPIIVRFSNSTGIPDIADDDPRALIKGMAVRFGLSDNQHTDLVLGSVPRFPAATPEELLDYLIAVRDSADTQASPTPLEQYVEKHPAAKAFVEYPRPVPASFAALSYHSINAFRFINDQGKVVYGRYIVEPFEDEIMLHQEVDYAQNSNYLIDEIRERLPQNLVKFHLKVQLANADDEVNDATVIWPETRRTIELGTLVINAVIANTLEYQQETMFNPLALTDGIKPSRDPLLLIRPSAYAISYEKRNQ